MSEIVSSIFAQVPWLKVFLAWTLSAAIVWLVVALPAYFLYSQITQRLRGELSTFLRLVREGHVQNREERKSAEALLIAQYTKDHLLRHVDESSSRIWKSIKTRLLQAAHEIQA